MNDSQWSGKRVVVTGHTGFKGGWLTLWLHYLDAIVHGFALDPPTDPCFFETARVKATLASDTRSDIRDLTALNAALAAAQPEVIFHLAAQPLVRRSYQDPLDTLNTNVMGTAHVLEAARTVDSVRAIVIVTTDKVYENREWVYPYREIDPLGGHDPYSASKAASEIVVASYRSSFFGREARHPVRIATARAGNVVGGGDWATDRLIPDCLRAFAQGQSVRLRFPGAVRPWQHVLEPLAGYLELAEHLIAPDGEQYATAWNFGPDPDDDATVGEVAELAATLWGHAAVEYVSASDKVHEAGLLRLDSTRARLDLRWRPRWSLQKALENTICWHKAWIEGKDMQTVSLAQIRAYQETA